MTRWLPIFQLWEPLQISIDDPDHQDTMVIIAAFGAPVYQKCRQKLRDIVRFDRGDALLKQVRLGVRILNRYQAPALWQSSNSVVAIKKHRAHVSDDDFT